MKKKLSNLVKLLQDKIKIMTQKYKKLNDNNTNTTQTPTLSPLADFSVITNLYTFLSLPYSVMSLEVDDSPTPTDTYSHHGKLKMLVYISQNVCILCQLHSSFLT
jgi:hypothetical protein